MTILNMIYGSSGGGGGWQPGANTVAYYPLTTTSTTSDMSGNSHNLTRRNSSYGSFGTHGGVDCFYTWQGQTASGGEGGYFTGDVGDISTYTHTISLWANRQGGQSPHSLSGYIFQAGYGDSSHKGGTEIVHWDNEKINYAFWYDDLGTTGAFANNNWHNIVCIFDKASSKQKLYVDGVSYGPRTTDYTHTLYSGSNFQIGSGRNASNAYNGYVSEIIIESKEWTADEVLAYYNQTKAKYGIS